MHFFPLLVTPTLEGVKESCFVIAKGIPRGCQGLFTPVSLGYPLSVFNKNSTLTGTVSTKKDLVPGLWKAKGLARSTLRHLASQIPAAKVARAVILSFVHLCGFASRLQEQKNFGVIP